MILDVIAKMRRGKTLFATCYALEYSKKYPNNKIFANYKLKLPNFIYTPYMFLPESELSNCLIIADDFYSLSNLEGFISLVVNKSGKLDIEIIMTCQYYTMIPPKIRLVSDYRVECKYIKEQDILFLAFIDLDNQIFLKQINNAVQIAKEIYDTYQVVERPTEKDIAKEIIKFSKNQRDIEKNIEMFTHAISKQNRIRKLIRELKEF